jgi:hypothetical protein
MLPTVHCTHRIPSYAMILCGSDSRGRERFCRHGLRDKALRTIAVVRKAGISESGLAA